MEQIAQRQNKIGKRHVLLAVYLLLAAFGILFIASRSSYLYPCNDWNDANSYFSVGKGMMNGKVPYRDIFDQKGPLLYFLYGLAYLVSNTTFTGVFLLELLLAAADLCAIYRILRLYMKSETALVLTPLPLALTFASYSFYYGGSAEEICLPFLLMGLYLILRYLHRDYPEKPMSRATLFIGGLLAGCVANIKFTVLGFFFAWMMCVALSYFTGNAAQIFTEHSIGEACGSSGKMVSFGMRFRMGLPAALKACGIFLLGMAVPFVPFLLYFAWHHALQDWYFGYVYINVFAYSNLNAEGPSLTERIYTLAKLLYWVARKNLCTFLFIIPGTLFMLQKKARDGKRRFFSAFTVLMLCFFLFLGIYVGGSELPYYALPLSMFTVFGFVLAGRLWERLSVKNYAANQAEAERAETERTEAERAEAERTKTEHSAADSLTSRGILSCAASLCVSILLLCMLSMNFSFRNVNREDHFLYKLKATLEAEAAGAGIEEPTLLNIGCLDAGLYTVCDIVPTCRWFQTQTVIMDTVLSEQERYMREGQVTFVLARDSYPDVILEQYELVTEEPWTENGQEFTYYLFEKKGTTE